MNTKEATYTKTCNILIIILAVELLERIVLNIGINSNAVIIIAIILKVLNAFPILKSPKTQPLYSKKECASNETAEKVSVN